MDKTLEKKAVTIKGRKYVLVSDRVIFFNENYPEGSIKTELITQPTDKIVVIKATVTPDVKLSARYFTGYSQAVIGEGYINKTAALENAETSAVGRALALMGIGVIDSIASIDELTKASNTSPRSDYNYKAASTTASLYASKPILPKYDPDYNKEPF